MLGIAFEREIIIYARLISSPRTAPAYHGVTACLQHAAASLAVAMPRTTLMPHAITTLDAGLLLLRALLLILPR